MKRRAFLGGVAASAALLDAPLALAAEYRAHGTSFSLRSAGIEARFSTDGGVLRMVGLTDLVNHRALPAARELFTLTLADGSAIAARACTILDGPAFARTRGTPRAARYSARIGAGIVTMRLRHPQTGALFTWRTIASDGAAYLRTELTIDAELAPLAVRDVRLIDFPTMPDARPIGTCDGSPIVAHDVYFAVEHPFAQTQAFFDRAYASYPSRVDVQPGVPLVTSAVIGAARPGQLRRDFLTYVERERAHPYRTFLHYNSWYDIGYFTRYDERDCLSRIAAFGDELHARRGVTLASFLFDDGWDDPNDLWAFNAGFPHGFAPLAAAAERYGARPGAWLSPWGGYGTPRRERLAAAKREGYELDADGLALSGPRYYTRFHDVVMNFIAQGVNQFKLDGTGDAGAVVPGSRFSNDFAAAIALIADMRAAEPAIYVNLTTGTYPSPFWLRYADSIWRGGEDHAFTGEGSDRQQWITYRDADTYAGIVNTGPLYPLNSLMLHGLIYAQHAEHLATDPHGDFRSEIRSYFGSGTQLQELYVTPSLLAERDWDDLAEAARWSAAHAGVLRDTHWVGGNPARLDPYGWAAWSPHASILTLRNPSRRTRELPLDIAHALELPDAAARTYRARSPWRDAPRDETVLTAGREHLFVLDPFEVRTLELHAIT